MSDENAVAKYLLRQNGNFVRTKDRMVERVGQSYMCSAIGQQPFRTNLIGALKFLKLA